MYRSGKRTALVACILGLFAVGCGGRPDGGEEPGGGVTATPADRAWWRALSQGARNQAILDRAARDVNRYVDQSCKEWVRTVVQSASRNAANIPATCPDSSGWYWCPSSDYGVVGISTSINHVQPGWIVQMRRKEANGAYGPHTAIVVGIGPTSVTWIDSNFFEISQPDVVKVHTETFADFERATCVAGGCDYAAYFIGGN